MMVTIGWEGVGRGEDEREVGEGEEGGTRRELMMKVTQYTCIQCDTIHHQLHN